MNSTASADPYGFECIFDCHTVHPFLIIIFYSLSQLLPVVKSFFEFTEQFFTSLSCGFHAVFTKGDYTLTIVKNKIHVNKDTSAKSGTRKDAESAGKRNPQGSGSIGKALGKNNESLRILTFFCRPRFHSFTMRKCGRRPQTACKISPRSCSFHIDPIAECPLS